MSECPHAPPWARMLRARHPELQVYIMGIGGAGLAPLAMVLQDLGVQVSGSELRQSATTERLQARGMQVTMGQTPEYLRGLDVIRRPDVVLHSSAVPESNPELQQAAAMELPRVTRSEFLPALLAQRDVLAVAGTHGKSTTTSMLVQVLKALGREPGYIVGAISNQMEAGQAGSEKLFVIEADEYDGMFLGLTPMGAVVTSVDWDHPDCYPEPEDLHAAFASFLDRIRPGGFVIYNGDSPFLQAWLDTRQGAPLTPVSFGLEPERDWVVQPRNPNSIQGSTFDITARDGTARFAGRLQTAGVFNQCNATAAWLAACQVGAMPTETVRLLWRFQPIRRRYEHRGSPGGVHLFDDYAHHPTAVRQTLDMARSQLPHATLWAVFQPHTFSRTAALLPEFAVSFGAADRVVILPTFAAREAPADGKDGRHLYRALAHKAATYCESQDAAVALLQDELRPGDSVVVMGAGDCVALTTRLLATLTETQLGPGKRKSALAATAPDSPQRSP